MVLGHFYHKIYYYPFDNGDTILFFSFLLKNLLWWVAGFTAFFALRGIPKRRSVSLLRVGGYVCCCE